MNREQNFIVQFNGAEKGPFNSRELGEMVEQKILTHESLCSPDIVPRAWIPIRSCISLPEEVEDISASAASPVKKMVLGLVYGLGICLALFLLSGYFNKQAHPSPAGMEGVALENFLVSPQFMIFMLVGAVLCCTMVCAWILFIRYKIKK